MVAVSLRPYQHEQVDSVERLHLEGGYRSVLVEAATGSGKTTSAAELARRAVSRGETVLFLAHRRELIDQAAARFESFGLQVGIERGSRHAGPEPVVCASVQTLRGPRLAKFPRDAFDLIIVDECHHVPSPSYRAILAHFHTARIVGVTATVDRADGIALGEVFQRVAHRYGIERAIAEQYLVPVRGIQVEVPGMDLSAVRSRRMMKRIPPGPSGLPLPNVIDPTGDEPGETIDLLSPAGQARIAAAGKRAPNGERRYAVDLHPGDLGRAVIEPEAIEGVVVPLLELAGSRKTVVFAVDLNHANAIAESINAKRGDGTARVVHYKLKARERRAILDAHKAGEYQYLINVTLLTEGYDDPSIECIAMARPTQSRVLYCQAVGRALRLYAGKSVALLLDFVGVGSRFDLVGPEDALGKALISLDRYRSPNAPNPKKALAVMPRRVPAPIAPVASESTALVPRTPSVSFTTRLVELVRGGARLILGVPSDSRNRRRARKVSRKTEGRKKRSWWARLFGG